MAKRLQTSYSLRIDAERGPWADATGCARCIIAEAAL